MDSVFILAGWGLNYIRTFAPQNGSQQHDPWPAARGALPKIRRVRAIKLVALGEKT